MTGLGYLLAYDDLNEKKGNWMYVLTACHQNTGIAILKKSAKLFAYRKVAIIDDFIKPNAEYLIPYAFTK